MATKKHLADKKRGHNPTAKAISAIPLAQGSKVLYLFKAKASELYNMLSINRRSENKDEGYQRTLSLARVASIAKHIVRKKPLPGCIIVSLNAAIFDKKTELLKIPAGKDVGWVVDGQHRLAGAHEAAKSGVDIELPVVAFKDLTLTEQIGQFVTINREAKGVPTSLYLDLLGRLPNKSPADSAKERCVDIATALRNEEDSPFFERIVVTVSPKEGQISLTNFVRKIAPHVLMDKGILHIYTEKEQRKVISNYYEALRLAVPSEFSKKDSIFFKTVGFGALWNVFPTFFSLCLTQYGGFQVKDALRIFKAIASFDFASWRELGSGNLAETAAGEDLKTALHIAFQEENAEGSTLKV